jgi:hypothetical protein
MAPPRKYEIEFQFHIVADVKTSCCELRYIAV